MFVSMKFDHSVRTTIATSLPSGHKGLFAIEGLLTVGSIVHKPLSDIGRINGSIYLYHTYMTIVSYI